MGDVHELYKHLSNAWRSIPAANVRPRDDNFLNRPILLALFMSIPLQILNKILIEKILRVTHVKQLKHSAGNLAGRLTHQGQLDVDVCDVFIGEEVRTKCMVGWLDDCFLQPSDVCRIWGEAQTQTFVSQVSRMTFQFFVAESHAVQTFHCLLSACVLFVLQETIALGDSTFSDQVEELELSEGFTDLFNLFIIERQRKSTKVNFVIGPNSLQIILLEVFLLEELSRLHNLKGILLVIELRMRPEEILHPS